MSSQSVPESRLSCVCGLWQVSSSLLTCSNYHTLLGFTVLKKGQWRGQPWAYGWRDAFSRTWGLSDCMCTRWLAWNLCSPFSIWSRRIFICWPLWLLLPMLLLLLLGHLIFMICGWLKLTWTGSLQATPSVLHATRAPKEDSQWKVIRAEEEAALAAATWYNTQ